MRKTKTEYLRDIIREYRAAGERWPASGPMIAAWAIRNGLRQAHPRGLITQCARELADAMRQEYVTDLQGRRVRRMHALRQSQVLPDGKEKQRVFWVDIADASPREMEAAFQQRRTQIFGDCRQLKTDVDSFNDNNTHGAHIQRVFNFTEDLEESEQSTTYPGLVA